MCDVVLRVQNCENLTEVKVLENPINNTGNGGYVPYVLGGKYVFEKKGSSDFCGKVIEMGAQTSGCLGQGQTFISTDGENDWIASDLCTEACNSTSQCNQLTCPPGFTLSDGVCRKETTESGILSSTIYTASAGNQLDVYGEFGTRFYANADSYTYPLFGDSSTSVLRESGTNTQLPFTVIQDAGTNGLWESTDDSTGRLNIAGIWTGVVTNSVSEPVGEWVGYSKCVDIPQTTTYCIGIAADNRMRIRINDQTVAVFDNSNDKNYKFFHVIEVTLTAGANIIAIEGYNDGGQAAFGAEIYETDITTLQAVTTLAQLENLILWSTKDRIGEDFNIGENSGYSCPDGTLFDSCSGENQCTSIQIIDGDLVNCGYRIQNCKDANEEYLVNFSENESNPLYQDSVFELAGNLTLFADKCFKLLGIEVTESYDVENVTVITDHGTDNCLACEKTFKFQNCQTNETQYARSVNGSVTEGNVYKFESLSYCWLALGEVTGEDPTLQEVTVDEDLGPGTCFICDPCYIFEDCLTSEQITVRLSDKLDDISEYEGEGPFFYYPEESWENKIFKLYGNPFIDGKCYKFLGEGACPENADFEEIGAKPVYVYGSANLSNSPEPSGDCIDCCPRYTLTECENPTNQLVIIWGCESGTLDESLVYRFDSEDIDPNTCWTVELVPNPPIYVEPNAPAAPIVIECEDIKMYNGIDAELGAARILTDDVDEEIILNQTVNEDFSWYNYDLTTNNALNIPFDDLSTLDIVWYSDAELSNQVPDPTNVSGVKDTMFYIKATRKSNENCTNNVSLQVRACYQYELVDLDFSQNQPGADFEEGIAYQNFTSLLTSLAEGVFANNNLYNVSDYTFKWYSAENFNTYNSTGVDPIPDNTSVTPFLSGENDDSVGYYFIAEHNDPDISCRISHGILIKLKTIG